LLDMFEHQFANFILKLTKSVLGSTP